MKAAVCALVAVLAVQGIRLQAEQGVIRLMGQAQAAGLSLRHIADQLNEGLKPNKGGGAGRANTVLLIRARA
ncbi:MAG: hypothetical protein JW820_06975 [Spirochaetales bacterium]|nr:hypothetical protein [Spirochaetales bacterium]